MKLAKLSLAAITVAGLTANAFAADTLADAFKEGKVSGVLKAFMIDKDYDKVGTKVKEKEAFAVGGQLNFVTADFKGFKAGFEMQTSHTAGLDWTENTDSTVAIQNTLLSEAYLSYTVANTEFKAGRMRLDTPLIRTSPARLMLDFFEAATITNKSLPNTIIMAGAVTGWADRGVSSPVHYDSPYYTAYGKTKQGAFDGRAQIIYTSSEVANGLSKMDYYLEGNYNYATPMPVKIGAQYIGYADDSTTKDDSQMFGVMAKVGVAEGLDLAAYYTQVGDNDVVDGIVRGGIGKGQDPSYNSMLSIDGYERSTKAIRGAIEYDFKSIGLSGLEAELYYVSYSDIGVKGNDGSELGVDATYKFPGALKGLSFRARLANAETDLRGNIDQARLILNYKF